MFLNVARLCGQINGFPPNKTLLLRFRRPINAALYTCSDKILLEMRADEPPVALGLRGIRLRIVKYLMAYWPYVVLVAVLLVGQAACELSLPNCTASIVDNVVAMAQDGATVQAMATLQQLGVEMLLFSLGMMVCTILVDFIAGRTSAKIARGLRSQMFECVLSFSQAEVERFSTASLITRGTNDVQLVQMTSNMLQRMVFYSPILAIGGIIMVARTNPNMWWIIAVSVLAVLTLISVLFAFTMPKFKIMQTLVDRLNQVSREILTGLPVIRAFNREQHEEDRFAKANGDLYKTQLFTNRAMTFMMPVMMLVMNLTSVLVVWVGAGYVNTGNMGTGDLIAFITYTMVVVMGFLSIGMLAMMLPRANVAAERIDEVLSVEPSIKDPQPNRDAGLLAQPSEGIDIELQDVSFKYSADADPVLNHVNISITAGSTCAIVGATGCGKSTLLQLIERFYDVTEGRVLVGGIDVRELSQKTLRGALGFAQQSPFLFRGTVASNVSYSADDMPAQHVREAIEVAQAADFVDARPGGVDSAISQGGTNVSGGQRQRLSIARAVASDARAYLFDDSFSALDYKTDALLRAQLAQRMAGKTVVIVAQRISTVMNADKIIVLDAGHVVGQGTHEQLLNTCAEYREIAESQLSPAELAKGGAA